MAIQEVPSQELGVSGREASGLVQVHQTLPFTQL